MRKINTKFFVFLAIAFLVLSGAVFGLHRLQAGNIAEALLWQANQAEKDGNLDRAAKYLGRYLEFARDDLDEREHLALILSDPQTATTPQRRARARFVIEQVLAKDPHRHALRHRLCQTLIAGRAFDAAKEHLAYLEEHQAGSPEAAYLLGLWHEGQAQTEPALDAYRRALKIDPRKMDGYVRLAALLRQADFGKESRHAEEIDRLVAAALSIAPQDASVLSLAAQHSLEKGNAGIALNYLEEGLKENPHEPRLYLALARIHSANGKRGEAIEKLQLGLQKVNKNQCYDLRWSLANLLIDDNRLEETPPIVAEVRAVNPASADYLDARREMGRGRWFEAAKQLEKIRPALKGVKELAYQLDLYLGTCYEQLDEPALQLTAFQRAADADPTSQAPRRGIANALRALGQTAEALEIYRDLAHRSKDADEAGRRGIEYVRLLLQGASTQNPKELAKIDQELTKIEKTRAKSLDVGLLRAELLYHQGDKAKAEERLHDAIKTHPDRYEPWLALVSFAAAKGDLAQTKRLMQSAEQRFKDQADFRLAQIRYWTRSYDAEAEAALSALEKQLTTFTPREQSALLQAMAEAHYWSNRFDASARVMEPMLKLPLHAEDVRVRMQMLELAILQHDNPLATRMLSEIKRIEGDAGSDWSFGEALRLMRLGRKETPDSLDKARQLLTIAAARRPNWHPIVQARAELDELQGRPDQAIANYRRAIDLGSRDPQATKQLLVLLSQAQRFDEVEQLLARMQKQQGTTEDIVRYYAAHSYQRHDFKRAEFLMKQIVASNSNNYRDHLWMGQILSTGGHAPADAEKALRRAVDLAPQQPETWINLVRHLIGAGQNVAAKTEIDKAAQALPTDRRDLALAQCYELLGFLKDAADRYDAALKEASATNHAFRAAADFHLRAASFARAEALYRQLAQRPLTDEDAAATRRGLALALVRQNHPQKKADALALVGLKLDEKGLLPDGKIADAFDEQLIQAKVLGSLDHHQLRVKAVSLLEALQSRSALPADDQFFLARLHAQKSADPTAWAKARNLLKTLTQQYPNNVRYLGFATQQHIQRKEFTDAEPMLARLEAVEQTRKIVAGGFGSIEIRAKMLELRGLGSQAAALLTSYAEQPEAAPVRKLLIASLQGRLGNFREAIDLCEEVRQVDAFHHEANFAAMDILRANRPSEALLTKHAQWQDQTRRVEASLRDAIGKNAKDIPSRLHLAGLMEMQGKLADVEKLCREVLEESDTNLVALNNLAWLLGQRSESAAEALTLINRAIDKFGPRPELLDTRAIVLLNRNDVERALADLERVVNEAPTPTRLFHLSRAFEKARNTSSAQAMLRQANEQGLTLQQLHPVEQAEFQRVTMELGKRQ